MNDKLPSHLIDAVVTVRCATPHKAEACRQCVAHELTEGIPLLPGYTDLILRQAESLTFPPKHALYNMGDNGQDVFSLRRGLVKLVQYLPTGGYRIVRLLQPGDLVGMEVFVDDSYHHTAIALQEVDVCRIPVAALRALVDGHASAHERLLRRWQRSLDQADSIITNLTTGSAHVRIARLLLMLRKAHGAQCTQLTREDMGALLGLTHETVSRTIAHFKRDGWLTESADRFECQVAALEKMVTE